MLNTDAEGRLVLADALSLATEDEPDAIVDLATLTGACMVALGTTIAGIMGNDDGCSDQVQAAADAAGEPLWPLPLPTDTASELDSEVADIKNISGKRVRRCARPRGCSCRSSSATTSRGRTSTSPARPTRPTKTARTRKGGTGFGVRTLLHLLSAYRKPGKASAAADVLGAGGARPLPGARVAVAEAGEAGGQQRGRGEQQQHRRQQREAVDRHLRHVLERRQVADPAGQVEQLAEQPDEHAARRAARPRRRRRHAATTPNSSDGHADEHPHGRDVGQRRADQPGDLTEVAGDDAVGDADAQTRRASITTAAAGERHGQVAGRPSGTATRAVASTGSARPAVSSLRSRSAATMA